MSYLAMELARKTAARSADWVEPVLSLPLADDLAKLLALRSRGPLSRPETAHLRQLLALALDRATGKKVAP